MIFHWLQANATHAGLSADTMSTWFLKGFLSALRAEVLEYCHHRKPEQKKSVLFSMDLIKDGVHYALEGTSFMGQTFPSSQGNVLATSSVPSAPAETMESVLPAILATMNQLLMNQQQSSHQGYVPRQASNNNQSTSNGPATGFNAIPISGDQSQAPRSKICYFCCTGAKGAANSEFHPSRVCAI
jgi:hypothetical protein